MVIRSSLSGVLAAALACATCTGSVAQTTVSPAAQAPPAPASEQPKADVPRAKVSLHDRNEASKAFLEGAKALKRSDLRAAVKEFDRAFHLDPLNRDYSMSLTIAREHLLTQLVQDANKARMLKHDEQAQALLAEAYLLDPNNPIVAQHLNDLARDAESHNQNAILEPAEDDAAPPVHLVAKSGKQSFHLRSTETAVLQQVLSAYDVVPMFDSSVKNAMVRFDADDVDFTQIQQLLKLSTGTFFVPLDEKRVLVAADTKENRTKFERQILETIYLPGLTATEMSDMGNIARNVFEAQQANIQANGHTLTIRAPQDRIDALNQTFSEMLDGRSQIMLQVRFYEIDQQRETNIGAQLPQTTSVFNVPTEVNQIIQNNQSAVQQIISSGLANAGDDVAIVAILVATGAVTGTVFNQPFALFGGGLTESGLSLNQGATANLILNSSDTRMLDQVQLRVQDQEDATFRSGMRYPIVTSTYSNLATTSLGVPGISNPGLSSALQNLGIDTSALQSGANQTIPQVQYQDLGLTLKATPRIQQDHDVALKIDFKIDALAGQTLNGNPVLNSRQYTGFTTLRPGESAAVVSYLTKQLSAAVSGIPGLSELPGFQSTTNDDRTVTNSKLVILITPHIVRLSHTRPAGQLVMLPIHP
jgi:general secretion pathway protein D